jgi:hypothetical protein
MCRVYLLLGVGPLEFIPKGNSTLFYFYFKTYPRYPQYPQKKEKRSKKERKDYCCYYFYHRKLYTNPDFSRQQVCDQDPVRKLAASQCSGCGEQVNAS